MSERIRLRENLQETDIFSHFPIKYVFSSTFCLKLINPLSVPHIHLQRTEVPSTLVNDLTRLFDVAHLGLFHHVKVGY